MDHFKFSEEPFNPSINYKILFHFNVQIQNKRIKFPSWVQMWRLRYFLPEANHQAAPCQVVLYEWFWYETFQTLFNGIFNLHGGWTTPGLCPLRQCHELATLARQRLHNLPPERFRQSPQVFDQCPQELQFRPIKILVLV